MTPEAQRIAIAEACGWKATRSTGFIMDGWSHPKHGTEWFPISGLPDYLNDLNATHEAEKVLNEQKWDSYMHWLISVTRKSGDTALDYADGCTRATAPQRAEAFLRALHLWK